MRVVMFGSRGRRASLTVAVVLVVLFLAPSSHAAAPSVSFAQRFVPRAAAAFAPTAVQSPVFNAFAFASVWEVENGGSKGPVDGAKQAAYFRTVLNATTLPVLGNTPRGVNFCEVPIAPGANLFRGAYRWAAHADGSVCMDGASSSSASESFSACFRPNGTLELQDGPSVSLRIVPYGVAFEFTAVDEASQEKVVYREMLGRVTGTMYGVNVQGWGGWDSYFGDKSFGNSFLFQQVEEDWILFADAGPHSGRQYGLLISGINGFQGGYIATELDESSGACACLPPPMLCCVGTDTHPMPSRCIPSSLARIRSQNAFAVEQNLC